MTPRSRGKTEEMGPGDVRARAESARQSRALAQIAADDPAMTQQTAMLAVQAGIAAVDAICGHELGLRFRGQDHKQASSLLDQVRGAGDAVRAFGVLVAQKDTAEYSSRLLGSETLKSMTRALEKLVTFMDEVLTR